MKNNRSFRYLVLPFALTAAIMLAVVPVALAGHDDHVEARALLQRGEILPLNRILSIVQQQNPGDVIEVELDQGKHGWEYEVKVLAANGHVRKIHLNARNGVIRKVKDD